LAAANRNLFGQHRKKQQVSNFQTAPAPSRLWPLHKLIINQPNTIQLVPTDDPILMDVVWSSSVEHPRHTGNAAEPRVKTHLFDV